MTSDPSQLIQLSYMLLSLAGTAFTVGAIVYGRVSALTLRRRFAGTPSRLLTTSELAVLERWGRRDVVLFVATMATLVVFCIVSGLAGLRPPALAIGYVAVFAAAAICLGHHFAARCPVCQRRLGLQSGLGLPVYCEICNTALRANAPTWHAFAARAPTRWTSRRTLLGLPLFAIAIGPDAEMRRGIAFGWIAVGDVACGALAVGGFACGGLAIGGGALGVLAVGGIAGGIAAVGGVAVAVIALGGCAVGWLAFGGLALGHTAGGGVAIGVHSYGNVALRPFGR